MQPEFWHQRWQRGEIGWHLAEINVHLQEHWSLLSVGAGSASWSPCAARPWICCGWQGKVTTCWGWNSAPSRWRPCSATAV
jgi:hypothetical protein